LCDLLNLFWRTKRFYFLYFLQSFQVRINHILCRQFQWRWSCKSHLSS
jgi:hypothetical protein